VFCAGTTDWTNGLKGSDPAVEQVTRFCTEKSRFEVDLADARQHSLRECNVTEVGDISLKGHLAIRSTLGVIE
jgi:hypothetical protein